MEIQYLTYTLATASDKLSTYYKKGIYQEFTRSTKRHSQLEQNKSATTGHVKTENHVINWDEATIIGRESDRTTRWIREAVKIRKESHGVMNSDEGLPDQPRL